MESKTSYPGRVNKILHYVHLGYLDYIASRTLLLTPLPLQGGVLASTALEKYFKAIITVSGKELRGHLQDHHVEAVREYVPKLYERLNDEFLKFLERYHPNLEETREIDLRFNDMIIQVGKGR